MYKSLSYSQHSTSTLVPESPGLYNRIYIPFRFSVLNLPQFVCRIFIIKYFFTPPQDRLDLFQRIQILYYILSIEGSSTRLNHIGWVPSKC